MEDVDHLLLLQLKKLGCNLLHETTGVSILSINDISTLQFWQATLALLAGNKVIIEDVHLPDDLDNSSMSERFQLCQLLANCVIELGYRKSELGYQTFLYAAPEQSRQVLLFLMEKLSDQKSIVNEHEDNEDQDDRSGDLLSSIGRVMKELMKTPYIPNCCYENALMKVQEQFVPVGLGFGEKFCVTRIQCLADMLYLPTRDDIISTSISWDDVGINCHNADTFLTNAIQRDELPDTRNELVHSKTQYELLMRQHRLLIAGNCGLKINCVQSDLAPATAHDTNVADVYNGGGNDPDNTTELENLLGQLALAKQEVTARNAALSATLESISKMEQSSSILQLSINESHQRLLLSDKEVKKKAVILAMTDDIEEKLVSAQNVLDEEQSTVMELLESWKKKKEQYETIRVEILLECENKNSKSKELERLCQEVLEEREEMKADLVSRLKNLKILEARVDKLSNLELPREEFTKRIVNSTTNIAHQNDEINKVVKDLLLLQHEIHMSKLKLDRTLVAVNSVCARLLNDKLLTYEEFAKVEHLVSTIHNNCQAIMENIAAIGRYNRESKKLEHMLDVKLRGNVKENLEKVKSDIEVIQSQIQQVAQ